MNLILTEIGVDSVAALIDRMARQCDWDDDVKVTPQFNYAIAHAIIETMTGDAYPHTFLCLVRIKPEDE